MKGIIKRLFIICVLLMMTACYKGETNEIRRNTFYEKEDISIYSSQLVDTYLIACALYFNFESQNLIGETNEIGQQVESYFSPYKDHPFIKQMGSYVEESYRDFNFNVLVPLTAYCYWNEQGEVPSNQVVSQVFQTKEDFQIFLDGLKQFYEDTKARSFFESQQGYNQKIKEHIEKDFDEKSFKLYIQSMQDYVGNKDSYYPNQRIRYSVLTSWYRPSGASFYPIYGEDTLEFICFTTTLEDKTQENSFSLDRIVENAIHEYLHMYINPSVQKHEALIQSLSENKVKTDYVGSLYQNLPWNRIVDENIVRAVETRLYAQVLGDEEKAYNQILKKEIEWGGFNEGEQLYTSLKEYEKNRDKYAIIDDYIPELINVLFKE